MTTSRYGQLESSEEVEPDRLRLLSSVLDYRTQDELLQSGLAEGWHCFELGPGSGELSDWLCDRVGASGHVTALDIDASRARWIERDNFELVEADVVVADLGDERYDLTIARTVLEHIPEYKAVLDKLVRATRAGGWLWLQDVDSTAVELHAYVPERERSMWETLRTRVYPDGPAIPTTRRDFGALLIPLVRARGLQVVNAAAARQLIGPQLPMAGFAKMTYQGMIEGITEAGSAERAELLAANEFWDSPDLGMWSSAFCTVLARKPS